MHCHKIGMNHKSRTFSRRLRGTAGRCLPVQIFVAYPPPPGFRVEPPHIGHKRESPPPRSSGHSRKSWHSRTKKLTCIHKSYSPAGRSVLGETVPEVLSTALGRTQTEGTVSTNTDQPRPVNNVFTFFLLRFSSFRKIFLQSPTYACLSRRRVDEARDRLQTTTKHCNTIFSSAILYYGTYCSLLE